MNHGLINMGSITNSLSVQYADGYRSVHVLEQVGNTLVMWKRYR